jgi:hypothetical protein
MRKVKITGAVLLALALMPPANADVYVKVDANGNAVSGAIVCDAATCGEGSVYSKLTLAPGERYVLQNQGHAGIGNNNPGVTVKVDPATTQWTATSTTVKEVAPIQITPEVKITKVEVVTQTTWNPTVAPEPAPTPAPTRTPIVVSIPETSTVTSETATATILPLPQPSPEPAPEPKSEPIPQPQIGATMTTTQIIKPWFEWDFDWELFWQEFTAWLEAWDWNWND